jgi:hypothetical protein
MALLTSHQYSFCMKQNITPLLNNDPYVVLAAIEHGVAQDVEMYLTNGFDPNFKYEDTLLTPLGIACRNIVYKIKELQRTIIAFESAWCCYPKVENLQDLVSDIEKLEKIINILAPRTDIPTTTGDSFYREEAIKLLKERGEDIVAYRISQSFMLKDSEHYQ